jgi:acetyl-CoA acetyltransferase
VTPELRDSTAIVGVGETKFYKRGQSYPQTIYELAGNAIISAVEDAGLTMDDVDGLTYYGFGMGLDSAYLAQMLGIPQVRWSTCVTGGGGGCPGAIGLAAAAINAGMASVVVTVSPSQVLTFRITSSFATPPGWGPHWDLLTHTGIVAPGQLCSMIVRRHMYLYGTTREHMGAVAISSRANAGRMPNAVMRTPITMDDYLSARMISDPFCLLDYCQESDGAAATVTTSAERAKDLRPPPVLIRAAAQGGEGAWGQGTEALQMPDSYFAASGYRGVGAELYKSAGIGPDDIDVAEIYDHFSGMVLLQLEDLGFCKPGESGPFALEGGIRLDGKLPVNTHGGSHSHVNLNGMTHVTEAVRQMRGEAVNQVVGAETSLVTGGPSKLPMSALILRKG